MKDGNTREIKYCIFDPTGNITALVETGVEEARQPEVASLIMGRHPDVEQVGFVRLEGRSGDSDVSLRMAGGEFCGNATMSAAALYALRKAQSGRDAGLPQAVRVKVSGAPEPLDVKLERKEGDSFFCGVKMPPAVSIDSIGFSMEGAEGETLTELPLIRMGGIDHIVIDDDSFFFRLKENKEIAEMFIKKWCALLDSDCLGIMFLEDGEIERMLTPLVYVPGADTIFWENSCASGSAAVGMYLASEYNAPVDISLSEPAGILRVKSEPAGGETWLFGTAKPAGESIIKIDMNNI